MTINCKKMAATTKWMIRLRIHNSPEILDLWWDFRKFMVLLLLLALHLQGAVRMIQKWVIPETTVPICSPQSVSMIETGNFWSSDRAILIWRAKMVVVCFKFNCVEQNKAVKLFLDITYRPVRPVQRGEVTFSFVHRRMNQQHSLHTEVKPLTKAD